MRISSLPLCVLLYVLSPLTVFAEDWTPSYNQNGTKTFYGTGNLTNEQAMRLRPTFEIVEDGFKVSRNGKASFSSGTVDLVDRSKVTKRAAATAIGKFIGRVAGPLTVGVAAYDLAKDLGFFIEKPTDAPGDVLVTRTPTGQNAPPVSTGYKYRTAEWPSFGPWYFSEVAACASALAYLHSVAPQAGYVTDSCGSGVMWVKNSGGSYTKMIIERKTAPECPTGWYVTSGGCVQTLAPIPSSIQELEDAIAQASGWPTSDTLAAFRHSLPYADPVPLVPISVTAPPSVSKPPVVKETPVPVMPPTVETRTVNGNPHGLQPNSPTITKQETGSSPFKSGSSTVDIPNKSTTTSTYDPATDKTTDVTQKTSDPHTVKESTTSKTDVTTGKGSMPGQPEVNTVTGTTTTTTTTTITNNVTNISTTVQSTETKPDDKDDDVSFSDTALGDIPTLYERKYPDGLTGIWTEKLASFKSSPLFRLVDQLMPSVATSGACPSWSISLDFSAWASYGTHEVGPPCWVWDFGRAVVLISALLLARALIFGG